MNQMGNRVGLRALMKLVLFSLIHSLIQRRGTEHPLGSSAKAKHLTQLSTNFFCKGPRSIFSLVGQRSLLQLLSSALWRETATDNMYIRGHGCVPAKKKKKIYKKAGGPGLASCPGLTNS